MEMTAAAGGFQRAAANQLRDVARRLAEQGRGPEDLGEIVDVEQQDRQRVLVADGALNLLLEREIEHARRDQRGQRIADGTGRVGSADLFCVRAENLGRRPSDGVGNDGPRVGCGAEPIVQRHFRKRILPLANQRTRPRAHVAGSGFQTVQAERSILAEAFRRLLERLRFTAAFGSCINECSNPIHGEHDGR
jgi:hypothetical protein